LIKNNLAYILIFSFVLIASQSISAFAQTGEIPNIIDGIQTSHLIAAVAIVGISLQTYKGMIGKKRSEFSINQLIFTSIVGIGAAMILVGNSFQNMSVDMNDTELMIFLSQQVITVMGAKTIMDIGKKNIPQLKSKENIFEMPEEHMEELPPGRSNV